MRVERETTTMRTVCAPHSRLPPMSPRDVV